MLRAIRRHHAKRLKNVRRHYQSGHAGSTPRLLGIYLNNPRNCSCWMCGNERKYFGRRTIKEKSDLEVINKDMQ